ncbi:hypothetical protein [Lichenicola cladoniae]|nr:hypothetical protein [Lichenicola cladoniae]
MSTRSRLVRRVLMALLAGVAILLLERTGVMEHFLSQVAPARFDWNNDYQLVEHLRRVVVDEGLTHDRKDCLLFIINGNDPPDASRLQVMEKHSGSCPGAKGELPKLFTVRVNRLTHTVQTDAGTTGTFHPLP